MFPTELQKLVSNFADNYDSYKNAGYNETQLRREFLDKLIKILGWDIDNEKGNAETFKEVIHEDRIKIGGQSKAPDYSVQFGGRRLFFIEAKKPFVFIKDEIDPAFQIRRYGWNAKLPLSILTDFEEFAVYDTTIKPNANDKPSTARIFYCRFNEYEAPCKQYPEFDTNWDFIAGLFSQNAVLKGSLEKFERKGKKKGTDEVDDEFLKDIESWRELLAKNLALRNELTQRDLNFAVQTTIDRIIFLRICEDRGIEEYGRLEKISKDKDIYKALVNLFEEADAKYNSGLFHFANEKGRSGSVDTLTPKLLIDDKPLKDIIKGLYYPCPYEFSVMPADILGSVYERFLGKVIRLSSEHRATIEEKPEVRKAGGVYYTPSYIVDYIVKNTVGKLLKDKTPKQIEGIRVLDPACGSGSFLIVAYQFLLDWYLNEYLKDKEKYKKFIYQTDKNNWRLTTSERKRILISHIYGVDIDSQAVEVTKLSLLLKVLEGESKENIQSQMKLFKERALPDLNNNIKCGNSLIGSDFYSQLNLNLTEEDQYKINVFDWEKEFPEVFKDGGFDAVIGNPPYVNLVSIPKTERDYFQSKFKTCRNKSDLYSFFIEKTLMLVNKKFNRFGYIVPHTWLATDSFKLLRKELLNENHIEKIAVMGLNVFRGVTVSTVILIGSSKSNKITVQDQNFKSLFSITPDIWINDNYDIDLNYSLEKSKIYKKLKCNTIPLKKIIQFSRGIKTSNDKKFLFKEKQNIDCKKVFRGRNIKSYELNWAGEYVWYRPDLMKEKAGCVPHTKDFFEVPEKLVTQRVNSSMQLLVAYDNEQNYFLDTTNVSRYDSWDKSFSLKYILGLLNSKLLNFWYCNKYKMPTIGLYELHSIPVPNLDLSKNEDKVRHDKMVELVDKMLELKKKEQSVKNPAEKTMLSRQIEATDTQIDHLTYTLYALTDEEIKIVEGGK